MNSPLPRWSLPGVLLLAMLARGAYLAMTHSELHADPDGYRLIAENLLRRGVFSRAGANGPAVPTAYRPPLYPLVLSGLARGDRVSDRTVAVFHFVLGVATVALAWLLARQEGIPRATPLAATLVAIDPILLNQSSLVMTETLATFLAALALVSLTRHAEARTATTAALAGASLALATLCRPTFLVMWGLGAIAIGLFAQTNASRRAHLLAYVGFGVLLLSPWTVRNCLELGRPIITTTHGGYTLLLGNNRFYYDHLRQAGWGEIWEADELQRELATTPSSAPSGLHAELRLDQRDSLLARQTIREQPGMFVWASLIRVARFWSPCPQARSRDESLGTTLLRVAVAVYYVVLFFACAAGLWPLRWWAEKPLPSGLLPWGLLLCVTFTLMHAVYWSDMRMRAPLTPFLCVLAARGVFIVTRRSAP